jgi:hypothetical protein
MYSTTLLYGSIALLILSLAILPIVMIKSRVFNLHRIWDLALTGSKLARVYLALIITSSISALLSVFLLRSGL